MYTALTIAGSDSSGGAGIQADIKTMTMNGVYAESVVTALTAQNTTGVKSIQEVTPQFLQDQLECVFTDIYPDAVKIGMVPSAELIKETAEALKKFHAKNIVVDPVMVATSGASLMKSEALSAMTSILIPLASVITPNIPEAEVLWKKVSGENHQIKTEEDVMRAAEELYGFCGSAVLIKGGHGVLDANDFLFDEKGGVWFKSPRVNNSNTHGTGCTLSSAIASNLAKGFSLRDAIKRAKEYLTGAIEDGLDLGQGSGPLNHLYSEGRFL